MNLLYLECKSFNKGHFDSTLRYLKMNEKSFIVRGYTFFVLSNKSKDDFSRNLEKFIKLCGLHVERRLFVVGTISSSYTEEEFNSFKDSLK